jgi:hypothetical protein
MFVFVMDGLGVEGNVTVKVEGYVAADTYGIPPAPRLGNTVVENVVAPVVVPGTRGPCGVAVNVRVEPISAVYVDPAGITDAAPGEGAGDMALNGMSRPGFSVPVFADTVTLTLLVDVPAGYVPVTFVTAETAVPMRTFEFRYRDVSDVSPLITCDPTVAVTYPAIWNVDERLIAQSV